MAELQLTTDAAEVARAMHRAANEVVELEAVNRRAGAIIVAAPPPRRSGQLAASVRADVTDTDTTVAGHTSYWTYVHWGAPRIHVKAQPWLFNQLHAKQDDIIELYREHAAAVVARAGD